ncbi:MAG: zinc ribbon domain-containing protein [Anaerolineales bacterium]|nr:zinc ribbon domain-containing protein [Anaerolineales bacterium]
MTNEQAYYCDRCGSQVRPTAKFCPQCGAPLSLAEAPRPQPQEQPQYIAPAPKPAGPLPTQVAAPEPQTPPTEFMPPQASPPSTAPPPYQEPFYQAPPPAPEEPPSKRTCLILAAVGLVLALLICCLAVGALWIYPEYIAEATNTPTIPVAMAPPPEPDTPAPTPASEEPPPPTEQIPPEEPPLPAVDYANVHFQYHPELASEIVPETVPAYSDPNGPPWELAPEHLVFNFLGYPLPPEALQEPRVYVYPANEYTAANPPAGQVIADLRAFLDRQPAELAADESIPALPILNAAQVMQSNIAYLEFQNGRGVRFLTQYAQDVYPINNRSLFYTFQGLTHDGRYVIAAILPVNHPILNGADSIVVDDAFVNDFANYVQTTERDLSAQPPESFSPNLTWLDETMQTFRLE